MKKQHKSLFVLIIFIIFVSGFRYFELTKYNSFIVVFFNTQEGDAILIRDSNFCSVLIDGGSDFAVIDSLYKYLPFYKRQIDYVFVSHPHHDHIHGLNLVSKRFEIKNLYYPSLLVNLESLDDLILRSTKSFEIEEKSKQLKACGLDFKVYKIPSKPNEKDLNLHSLVLEVYKDEQFIFFTAGDIYEEQENYILNNKQLNSVYLFKSNHHGSKTSNSQEFLNKLKPKVTVVTSGYANRFKHPHLEPLRIITKNSQKVLRTDIEGEIVIEIP